MVIEERNLLRNSGELIRFKIVMFSYTKDYKHRLSNLYPIYFVLLNNMYYIIIRYIKFSRDYFLTIA